jgi:hypothetical protein
MIRLWCVSGEETKESAHLYNIVAQAADEMEA